MAARNLELSYYASMNITISVDEKIIRKVRKIAVERETTLTALVRGYLEKLAAEASTPGSKKPQREALEHTFKKFSFPIGNRTWKREDLHERPRKCGSNKES
jgi:hypothetical protein